jgi:hemoglobin
LRPFLFADGYPARSRRLPERASAVAGPGGRKLFEYLTGWLGGPPLYTDKYGHPRLRQRHFVAAIGPDEIEGWLLCFHRAWNELAEPSPVADAILTKIDALGWHMRNQAGAAPVA